MPVGLLKQYQAEIHGLVRIVVGFLFMTHGGQKLFGWFGAESSAQLMSEFGLAGVLEFFGGLMIMLGWLTGPVAFVLAGQMAVAYFWKHVPRGFWPWQNGGELAVLYSWVFLFFATLGSGSFSIDTWLAKRKSDTGTTP
ncbi:MAG: DoxX family protein [Gemmatimonadota bacterium]|nr:MAG: DoxX family protein [Gemmatimonadota bacterium]